MVRVSVNSKPNPNLTLKLTTRFQSSRGFRFHNGVYAFSIDAREPRNKDVGLRHPNPNSLRLPPSNGYISLLGSSLPSASHEHSFVHPGRLYIRVVFLRGYHYVGSFDLCFCFCFFFFCNLVFALFGSVDTTPFTQCN